MSFRYNVLNMDAVIKKDDLSEQVVDMWLDSGSKVGDLRIIVQGKEFVLTEVKK